MSEQTDKSLPLQGLRVIEMGQLIAGPFASKLLGEFGADMKVSLVNDGPVTILIDSRDKQ